MFYKFLKFIFLSSLTLIWGGCENKDDAVAGYGCFSTHCYNATAVTKNGKEFDIIECDDYMRYLRHPKIYYEDADIRNEIPRNNLNIQAPYLAESEYGNSCGIVNCKYIGPDICYEETLTDLATGTERKETICQPTIDCPEKK